VAKTVDEALRVRKLVCAYGSKVVLKDVDVGFRRRKITCVLGPSGCGKSTLLRNLLLLERPSSGRVLVGDVDVAAAPPKEVDAFRRRCGVLFQGAALFQSLTVLQNVAFPLLERGGAGGALAEDVARRTLAAVGLADAADLLPSEISGGMRKRAGIARALVGDPEFLFLDEPSAGLDPTTAAGVDGLVLDVRDRFGATIVVITHEVASLHLIADDLVFLADGAVAAAGSRETVENSPHPVIRAFFERRARRPDPVASAFRSRLDARDGGS
jgi:phospholipid/cholesterol/gamma-HCH transport system ATP-binding protein